jgi:PST family polysaccharide transporter
VSSTGLAGRALRGVRWNYIGAVGRIAATFVSQIVLARLLGPEQFGLFGYAFLTVTMAGLVVEMGLQNALVQVAELDDEVLAVACGRLLLVGAIAAALVFLLSDVIASHVFATPVAAPVLRAMAPTLVVGAAFAAATAMLSRDIDFKAIQLAALGSYVVGYLFVGVAAALMGLGVWSLVIAWHVQTVIACLILVAKSPRSLAPANPLRKLPIARFGLVVMFTHLANWVIDNAPHASVGRWLGASTLGLYTVANNLVKVPADHLLRNIQLVLHALASRAQDNDAGLRRAYLTVMGGIGVIAFPTFTFVALMAEPLVSMLLGPKWLAAAAVLVPLAFAMVLHVVEGMAGPTLSGRGEPAVELRVKLVMIALSIPVLFITVRWSLSAVGWGVALIFLLRCIWMNMAVSRRLGITATLFAQAMTGPLLLAAIAWAVPSAVMAGLAAAGNHLPAAWLIAVTAVPAGAIIIAVAAAAPKLVLGPYLLALLSGQFEKRPTWAARAGMRRLAASASQAALEVANPHIGASASWTRRHKTS